MTQSSNRKLLLHYLASIAYHIQKAIRNAPDEYWKFSAGNNVRTPEEILIHMTGLLGYIKTLFNSGVYKPEPLPDIQEEISRFHKLLEEVAELLDNDSELREVTELQLLQGPLSDIMTHIGQLSMLRRLYGDPVPPENFIDADISPERLGKNQPAPKSPDKDWPEAPDLNNE